MKKVGAVRRLNFKFDIPYCFQNDFQPTLKFLG